MERAWTVGRVAEWLALVGKILETAGIFLTDLSEDLVYVNRSPLRPATGQTTPALEGPTSNSAPTLAANETDPERRLQVMRVDAAKAELAADAVHPVDSKFEVVLAAVD